MASLSEVKIQDGRVIGWVGELDGSWVAIRKVGVFISPLGIDCPTEFQALATVYREAYKYGVRPSKTALGDPTSASPESDTTFGISRRYDAF